MSIARAAPETSAARWKRFAPATKNIVNAVRVMTIVVPRSGSLKTSSDDRRDDDEERDRPAPEPADASATLGEPVGEVDDQRELGELGRVDRGQRPDLSQRAEPPTSMLSDGTKTSTSRTIATTYIGTDTRRR